jgi:hypothetical protein
VQYQRLRVRVGIGAKVVQVELKLNMGKFLYALEESSIPWVKGKVRRRRGRKEVEIWIRVVAATR